MTPILIRPINGTAMKREMQHYNILITYFEISNDIFYFRPKNLQMGFWGSKKHKKYYQSRTVVYGFRFNLRSEKARQLPEPFRHVQQTFRHIQQLFRHIQQAFRKLPEPFQHIQQLFRHIQQAFRKFFYINNHMSFNLKHIYFDN